MIFVKKAYREIGVEDVKHQNHWWRSLLKTLLKWFCICLESRNNRIWGLKITYHGLRSWDHERGIEERGQLMEGKWERLWPCGGVRRERNEETGREVTKKKVCHGCKEAVLESFERKRRFGKGWGVAVEGDYNGEDGEKP